MIKQENNIKVGGEEMFRSSTSKHIKMAGWKHIKKVKMQDSHGNNLVQLVDMIAGAVNRSLVSEKKNKNYFRDLIKPREMYIQIWPK